MAASEKRPIAIELDARLALPVYLQIVRQIQRHTGTGRLQPGAQLPTVRELARRLGVNSNTVARAYRRLAQTGAVSPQPGRGTFVLPASARRQSGRAALQDLAVDYIAHARRMHFSDAQIAAALKHALRSVPASARPGDNHG